jgi:hypothetical protein
LAPTGCSVPVVVYENEPSSIIAYALSSQEYQRSLDDMLVRRLAANEQATSRYVFLNALKPSGHYIYHLLSHTKTLHSAHTVYQCVPYACHKKQRLFPQTALTDWAL